MQEHVIASELAKAGLGTVTQQGVSAMLIRTEARALKALQERVGGHKARQTACLMLIYEEAMNAWERSKKAFTGIEKDVEQTADGLKTVGPMTVKTEDRDGNPSFLETAMKALSDVRKLWGLDAPEKYEVKAEATGGKEAEFMKLLGKAMDTMSVEELTKTKEHIDALNAIAEKAKLMEGPKDVTPTVEELIPGF